MSEAQSLKRFRIGIFLPDHPPYFEFTNWIKDLKNDTKLEIAYVAIRPQIRMQKPSWLKSFLLFFLETLKALHHKRKSTQDKFQRNSIKLQILEGSHPPHTDLVIDLTGNIPDANIIKTASIGALILEPGYNYDISALEAVLKRRAKTSFRICMIQSQTNIKRTIIEGAFRTQPNFKKNRESFQIRCLYYVKHAINKLAQNLKIESFSEATDSIENDTISLVDYFVFSFHQALGLWPFIRKTIQGKFEKQWSVGLKRENWKRLNISNPIVLRPPKGCFIADPFLIVYQDRQFCFVEEFDRRLKKGHIAVYDVTFDPFRLGTALIEPFHLSFPFIFKFQSEIFMVPECSSHKEIRLYRCTSFPLRWEFVSVLMRNVSAADTMIFPRGGHWWMFTNIDPSGTGEHCSELWAFYADRPDSSDWRAHSQNPILIDPSCARNGGLMIDGDTLYRVAQEHRFGEYGAACSVRRIITLDPNHFHEEILINTDTQDQMTLKGVHHISILGNLTVFDFPKQIKDMS